MTSHRPNIPSELGHYELVGQIASGAMGRIHLARSWASDGSLLGEVAIKTIRPELLSDPAVVQMFEDEAQISKRLLHPNVVRTLEVGELEGETWLAMERVSGVTLQELTERLAERNRVLPVPLVLEIVDHVLDALDYAHTLTDEQGEPIRIVHRDVSPQNIMVSFSGEVKLFDFGVGRARGKTHKTNPGFVKGKLAYMSPEQIRNVPFDARSDLFSVGVMAYESLVLVPPFSGKTDAMLMRAVMEREPPAPGSVDPQFPPDLEVILLQALEKDPARRFRSAGHMREALERFTSGRVWPAGPPLAELMQELFGSRIHTEARARRQGDDALLLRSIRGEVDEVTADSEAAEGALAERAQRRGEEKFAALPTAAFDVSDLNVESWRSKVDERPDQTQPREEGSSGFDRLPTLLPDGSQARALDVLRLIIETAPTPLYLSRLDDGQILFANEPMMELFGLGPTSAVGVDAGSLYANPADRLRVVEMARAEGVVRDHLVELERRGGQRFFASVSVRLVKHRGERVLIGSIADVSHQVAIESRLARRLAHQRHIAQAVAALLRTRDVDPGGVGLDEALEHLRVATDADRVVLAQNEEGSEGGRLEMHRSHVVGVESPGSPRGLRLGYEVVPRWRTLFERGEVVRGLAEAFPEAERGVLDGFGVTSFLAAPVRRRARWLGYLALEATKGRRTWSDEDVAALETMAGIIAGELERRQNRPLARIAGETAAWVSIGARLASDLPECLGKTRALVTGAAEADLRELAAGLDRLEAVLPRPRGTPVEVDLLDEINGRPGVVLSARETLPRVKVDPLALDRFVASVVDELTRLGPLDVRLRPTADGGVALHLRIPPEAKVVWEAIDGDPVALTGPGARIGALFSVVEAMEGELRFERNAHDEIVVTLPPASAAETPVPASEEPEQSFG